MLKRIEDFNKVFREAMCGVKRLPHPALEIFNQHCLSLTNAREASFIPQIRPSAMSCLVA